jgi:PAS domain S-box-containing protein
MISLLYVDDEPELLELGKLFLERSGDFMVTTVSDSTDVLRQLKEGEFDAIISDYQMPGIDGIELLKQVRGKSGTIPFILFTGKGREEVVIEAINNGADFYLQKGGAPRAQFAELRHKILAALDRRRAVDALRDSEQRLADIINFLPDATFAINTEGCVIAWNKAMETMTGIAAASMLGRGDYEYAIPFYDERRAILIDLVMASADPREFDDYHSVCHSGTTVTAEATIDKPDHTHRHIWTKASRLYDKDGNLTGAIESVRDVTDQKNVDETLRASEAKYRELVENANSIILKMDTGGNVTFFNEFAQRFFGFTSGEILGRPVVGTIVPPEETGSGRGLGEMIANLIRHPEAHEHNENQNITKGGRRVWIHWWNKPIFDSNGLLSGLLCVGTDITERKRVEDELRIENEKNRSLMDGANDAIFIADVETGMLVDANRKALELIGRSMDEIRGMPYTILYPNEFHDQYRDYFSRIAEEGTGSYFMMVVDRNGRQTPALVSNTALDLGGRRHVMGIFHDISEIRMAQEALQFANRKLNLVAEVTRHDIRNKLTVLRGYLDLVRDRPGEPEYSMYIQKIQDLVGGMGENIEFTKLYQNLGTAAPDWQNVHDIFFHACTRLDMRKIYVQSDTGGLEVFADPLLEQAFYNLVENTLQHAGEVTLVRITFRESSEGAAIIIEDNGTGIPAFDKEKIFTKGYGKNAGLGLFLVQEILSITGIRIRESGEYHKGSRFELQVPREGYRLPRGRKSDRCHIHLPENGPVRITGN